MNPSLVLDAGVLTLYFAGDRRVKQFFDEVDGERAVGMIAEVNLAEYYYKTCRKLGKETADSRYFMLTSSKLLITNDERLTRLAALEKCRQRLDLSLADCFALALAIREKAILLTTDRELKKAKGVQVKLFTV
ncbi:MAG TPA: type II toxin-antitoxin system VapC family toxin [archaeon]|nr:type II toxin-antitoxin system VapC family toxin [archaeon]